MPDRILRGSIIRSNKVNSLNWGAEVFYRRLMSLVDDFGCFDANPAIVRTSLYPKQLNKVSESDVAKWTREIAEAGLIRLYEHDNDLYLELLDFEQRLRQKRRRYPEPPTDNKQPADNLLTSGGQVADTKPANCPPVFDTDTDTDTDDEGEQPPPTPTPFGGMKDIDLIKESCIHDSGYFTNLHCMKYDIAKDQLYKWLINFNQWLKYQAITAKTERDYRTHFGNWFSKQENKKSPESWQIDKTQVIQPVQSESLAEQFKKLNATEKTINGGTKR